MCVALSSALAAKEMSRQDASVMAIFGSGWQADAQVPAFYAVRELKKINTYSPPQVNRTKFAEELGKIIGVPVELMASLAAN